MPTETAFVATNWQSSGIKIDKKRLKQLCKRYDKPGLIYLAKWALALFVSGAVVWATLGTWLVWPAMIAYGTIMMVPGYCLSHETAHGTPFRSRWLNETVLWVTSFIYMEEPLHRRMHHTSHHTFTWHIDKDSQMPFDTPMDFKGWLIEISGISLLKYHIKELLELTVGHFSQHTREVSQVGDLPKMARGARIFMAIYLGIAIAIFMGQLWLLWFLVLPRFLGIPAMMLYGLIQHVELQENSPSILESTRSFKTNAFGRFLYANMNFHCEHHLFPQVPFYALPELNREIRDQLPEPDPGFFRTQFEVLSVVIRRSLKKNTKAKSIRQAPHMITEGGYQPIATKSM